MALKGTHLSEELKRKLSEAHGGDRRGPLTADHRRKISEAHRGQRSTEAAKRKMSEAKTGERHPNWGKHLAETTRIKISQSQSGERGHWWGTHPSNETRAKVSAASKRQWQNPAYRQLISKKHRGGARLDMRGPGRGRWKGYETKSPLRKRIRQSFAYRQWRSDIFTRDDFTCRDCGIRGSHLHAHHCPKSFASILIEYHIQTVDDAMGCSALWNINNGATLCCRCHVKHHGFHIGTTENIQ